MEENHSPILPKVLEHGSTSKCLKRNEGDEHGVITGNILLFLSEDGHPSMRRS